MSDLLTQKLWTQPDLTRESHEPHERKNELIMARQLSEYESPKRVRTLTGEVMTATAGDMICYLPGAKVRATLDDYEHWPIGYEIFREIYEPWDETNWKPTPSEKDLMTLGCRPYYEVSSSSVKRATADAQKHKQPERESKASYRDDDDDDTEPIRDLIPTHSQSYGQRSQAVDRGWWQRFWEMVFKNPK